MPPRWALNLADLALGQCVFQHGFVQKKKAEPTGVAQDLKVFIQKIRTDSRATGQMRRKYRLRQNSLALQAAANMSGAMNYS